MVQIDDTTDTNSITSIFNKFLENNIPAKEVKVIVVGGWKKSLESFKWGEKVLTIIKECGVENISIKNMFSKNTPNFNEISRMSLSTRLNYFHCGALINSSTGETFILKTLTEEVEKEQGKQMLEFIKEYGEYIDNLEIPLKQIL